MRESEGGTLKHTLQYLYIGNTAQERPSHPSIFSAGRAKPLSTSPGSPNVFTTRSTTTTHTITDRVFIHLNSLHALLLTTATGARRVTMAPAAAAASAAAGDAKPTSASTPPASTPTPTQRKVTRSRLGCETCRARKVRCDERPGKCEWIFLDFLGGLISFSFFLIPVLID